MKGAPAKDGKEPPQVSKAQQSKEIKKDKNRLMNLYAKDVSLNQDYLNVKTNENKEVKRLNDEINKENRTINATNMNKLAAIQNEKNQLKALKQKIAENEEDMKNAEQLFQAKAKKMTEEFNLKKEQILKESAEVEAQLNHYAEWQRQSDSFKAYLSELKSTIHHNRVLCSEIIAENRQNAQAKIEKHRVELAEAIRKARAESLRLRSGDISEQSTTFLTQSEQQVQNLQQQLESSKHLEEVNETIEEDNMSMQQEIVRLQRKSERLRDQEEKQVKVITKLKAIKQEFEEREMNEKIEKERIKKREIKEQQRILAESQKVEPQKPPFRMSAEQDAFFTFLTECATSVRSVLKQIVGENGNVVVTPKDDRFEAPKLIAMIAEIKEMSKELDHKPSSDMKDKRPILTPAAAYFAFSAPFDDGDEFIKSENWSFSKYEPCKPTTATNKKAQPRIVRIKTGTKTPV